MIPVPSANAAGRERFMRRLSLLLGAISLCAAIAGSIAVLVENVAIIILAHLLAAVTGGSAGTIADRRRLGVHFFPWCLAFTMPLFGGIAAYFLLETMKRPRTGKLLEEYAVYLNDAASYKESLPLQEHTALKDPVSLVDILSNPASAAEQRIAIEYLADMETQSAFEILHKAALSANRETCFLAMTAMTQQEDKMRFKLGRLEESIRQAGENSADARLLLKTAAAYIDFIYYQLATGERRSEYLCHAETLLLRVLENHTTGASEINETLILLGRVKLGQNDGKSAAQYFGRYIERNPGQSLGYLWRAEAWYKLGNYACLREDCRVARKMGDIPPNMLAVLDLWLPEKAETAQIPSGSHTQTAARLQEKYA